MSNEKNYNYTGSTPNLDSLPEVYSDWEEGDDEVYTPYTSFTMLYENINHELISYAGTGRMKAITVKSIAQKLCDDLINKMTNIPSEHKKYYTSESIRIIIESLFYFLIRESYSLERFSAENNELISLEKYKSILDEDFYNYISNIYSILQLQFSRWLKVREFLKNNVNAFKLPSKNRLYSKRYWEQISELSEQAHSIYPKGEIANRMRLISDAELIYTVAEFRDVFNPENKRLAKYPEIRNNFVHDCFDCDYNNSSYDGPEDSFSYIMGVFPYMEQLLNKSFDEYIENKRHNKTFFFNEIMSNPAHIYICQNTNILAQIAQKEQSYDYISEQNKEIKQVNEELEKEKEEKIELINDFSHKYGKRKGSNLKDIAEYLLNIDNEDVRYYGRLALYEVSRKNNMDKDVEILKDAYSDDDLFQKKIKDTTRHDEGCSNLEQYIIEETIKSCIITLLYDKTARGSSLRYKVFNKETPEEIEDILYDYERRVIVDGRNALSWLKEQKLIDIRFNISGEWNNLFFEENEYSAIIITDILSELIFNAFKYAEQSNPVNISFTSDDKFIIIEEENTVCDKIKSTSGKGISSCNTLLKRFHKPLKMNFEPVTTDINGETFKEEIRLAKKLFWEE